MNLCIPKRSFSDLYKNFQLVSGANSGFLHNKVHQVSNASGAGSFYAMSSQFADYSRLYNDKMKVAYHLSGYGLSREEAFIRLIGEAIERYSLVHGSELLKRYFVSYSYNELIKSTDKVISLSYLNIVNNGTITYKVDEDDRIGWLKCIDVIDNTEIYVPAQMFLLKYFPSVYSEITQEKRAYFSVSTGTASHSSQKKALLNALIEYLQIDSFMLFWYTDKFKAPKVILDDYMLNFLHQQKLYPEDAELLVLDFTFDKPNPIFGIFIIRDSYPILSFGVQGGLDPYNTVYRGLLEALTIYRYNYVVPVLEPEIFNLAHNRDNAFTDLDSNVVYWASEMDVEKKMNYVYSKVEGEINIETYKKNSYDDDFYLNEILSYCKKNDYHVAALDITCPELENTDWSTVRVVIPELLPMCLPSIPFNNHPRIVELGGGVNNFIPHPLP